MKRKTIIIGCSGGYRGLELLKGVSIDIANYNLFLQSSVGGNWLENEITILKDIDSLELKNVIKSADADYTFVVYTGHGFINTFTKEDTICLKDQDVSIANLATPSNRQTIFIDACRESIPANESLINESTKTFNTAATKPTRELFDKAIEKTPEGIILVFSCNPNEISGDSNLIGGYFSYSILTAAKELANTSTPNTVITLEVAFESSKKILSRFSTTQNPEMTGQIRRLTFPPFAIN